MLDVRAKRIYDRPDPEDGYRILVDGLWPRGVSRERARLDRWARELAPSTALRRWFGHAPSLFPAFRSRYIKELADHAAELEQLRRIAAESRLTILYGARDTCHNNAAVLVELLRDEA